MRWVSGGCRWRPLRNPRITGVPRISGIAGARDPVPVRGGGGPSAGSRLARGPGGRLWRERLSPPEHHLQWTIEEIVLPRGFRAVKPVGAERIVR
ncbi:hypothetical protein GCM10025787_48080 [Saccharopolyspora rosea]